MNTHRRQTTRTLPFLAAVAACVLLSACEGGPGIFYPGRTWVATDPIQCLGNPWEVDWLVRNEYNYQGYPRSLDSQYVIIRTYYARLGVEAADILSVHKYDITCDACSCARGDVLYLSVRNDDVEAMVLLGYRKEAPFQPAPADSVINGVYRYVGYDSSGRAVITGTLAFIRVEETTVSGSWDFEGPDGYGPQVGSGTFEGSRDGFFFDLNLNPGWADNNVYLHGEWKNGTYRGMWEYATFVGPTNTGRFAAVKLYNIRN